MICRHSCMHCNRLSTCAIHICNPELDMLIAQARAVSRERLPCDRLTRGVLKIATILEPRCMTILLSLLPEMLLPCSISLTHIGRGKVSVMQTQILYLLWLSCSRFPTAQVIVGKVGSDIIVALVLTCAPTFIITKPLNILIKGVIEGRSVLG